MSNTPAARPGRCARFGGWLRVNASAVTALATVAGVLLAAVGLVVR